MKRAFVLAFLFAALCIMMSGCTQAEKVSANISRQADAFNVTRRVAVINARTDKPLLEVIGRLSVQKSSGDVDIIIEVAPGEYKKHFVHLNSWTLYTVEDISGAFVDPYHYEIHFLPEMFMPIAALKYAPVD